MSSFLHPNSLELIKVLMDIIRTLFIVIGGYIALRSYTSQRRQRSIDSGFNLLKVFRESIADEDIETWQKIYYCASESAGAMPYHFIVFSKEKKREQVPLELLFIPEGKGFVISNSSLSSGDQPAELLQLGAVRRIAERLNLMSYEIIYGDVELRIIYYEIGQIMDVIYRWINEIQNEQLAVSAKDSFPFFIEMYAKRQHILNILPKKLYVNLD